MKSRHIWAVLLILGMMAASLTSVYVASANHAWDNFHWARTANPFRLRIGDNVSGAWDTALNAALADWTRSTVLDTVRVAGRSDSSCTPTPGRVEVCSGLYGNNGWLGYTQIWTRGGGHIYQAQSKMNDTYFSQPLYNTAAERRHTMCHELGHALGLDHFTSGEALGTCMDYSMDLGSRRPNAHDYRTLESIYTHLDSFSTLGAAASSNSLASIETAGIPMDSPAVWGPLLHANEHSSVYRRRFSDGSEVTTFVEWVHETSAEQQP
jgi:hypothetical protein